MDMFLYTSMFFIQFHVYHLIFHNDFLKIILKLLINM